MGTVLFLEYFVCIIFKIKISSTIIRSPMEICQITQDQETPILTNQNITCNKYKIMIDRNKLHIFLRGN